MSFIGNSASYSEISRAYFSGFQELSSAIEAHQSTLEADGNFGLAKQVLESWRAFRLRQLSQVFITLPLERIAQELQLGDDLEAAGKYLYKAINDNQVVAQLNGETLIVAFGAVAQENALTLAKKQLLSRELNNSLHEMMLISNDLREVHKSLLSSQKYLMKSSLSGRSGWQGSSVAGISDYL